MVHFSYKLFEFGAKESLRISLVKQVFADRFDILKGFTVLISIRLVKPFGQMGGRREHLACGLDAHVKRIACWICFLILLAAGGTIRLFLWRWQLHVVELVCMVQLLFCHFDKFSCFLGVFENFKQWALVTALSIRPDVEWWLYSSIIDWLIEILFEFSGVQPDGRSGFPYTI